MFLRKGGERHHINDQVEKIVGSIATIPVIRGGHTSIRRKEPD